MIAGTRYSAVCAALLLAAPAAAQSCRQDVDAFERRLADEGRKAVSTSTSGKETGARREAQAQEAGQTDQPVATLPAGPTPGSGEEQAQQDARRAGGGGVGVMEAKASLNAARVALDAGDEAKCRDALAKAQRDLQQAR